MSSELELTAKMLAQAIHPEDVFGLCPAGTNLHKHLKRNYALLARKVHPDVNLDQKNLAEQAFNRLSELHKQAEDKVNAGKYGDKNATVTNLPPLNVVIKGVYERFAAFGTGDIADLHLCQNLKDPKRSILLLKIARDPIDNELMQTERDSLSDLAAKIADNSRFGDWGQCIPKIFDSFLVDDGSKNRCRMNVLGNFEGFYNTEQIHQQLPTGVDGRTIAWMWKRLLGILNWTHASGYIHGAILPPHVLYYPDNDGKVLKDPRKHAVRLVDFCYSRKLTSATKLVAWVPTWQAFYPPEVVNKKPVGPSIDLYMGAKTMLYLLGGDPSTDEFPSSLEKPVAQAIALCLAKDPGRRPKDTRLYFSEFVKTLERVYGKPKYHRFEIPLTSKGV
jgi:serine/threonine protein kinase